MNILVVNDDGINAKGILKLAEIAKRFGNVTVVGPKGQCSAVSQKLTLFDSIDVIRVDFPIDGVDAYSVDGTPADCVKIGVGIICEVKPDIVFSGINMGCNIGYDIAYSGTIAACFESLQFGIPAFAFSKPLGDNFELVDMYLENIIKELLGMEVQKNELINVNFPKCGVNEVNGILWNRTIAPTMFYTDSYIVDRRSDGSINVKEGSVPVSPECVPEGTDIDAIYKNYISIGKVINPVIAL